MTNLTLTTTSLIYPLSDTFGIDLKRSEDHLIGEESHILDSVLPNSEAFPLTISVVDSLVLWHARTLAAILVHISGDLFCLAISECKADRIIKLFLLDGTKLGIDRKQLKKRGFIRFLPKEWNRASVYKSILPGLKAGYWKRVSDMGWTPVPDIRNKLEEYIDSKNLPLSADEATDKFKEDLTYLAKDDIGGKHDE